MANTQGTGLHPPERGAFFNQLPIFIGGETSSPGRRGLVDLAYNNNFLLAQHSPSQSVALPAGTRFTGTDVDLLYYRVYVPDLPLRASLVFSFDVEAVGTVDIRVYTSADNDSTGAVGTSAQTLTVAASPGVVNQIRVRGTTAGGAANIANFRWHLAPYVGDLPAAMHDAATGACPTHIPAADDAYDVDFVRDLLGTPNFVVREFVMHPILWSDFLADAEPRRGSDAAWTNVAEYLYFPAPGVTTLEVYANGYTDAWTSGDTGGAFRLYFDRRLESVASIPLAAASATWTEGDWAAEGVTLRVPALSGPLVLRLDGRADPDTANRGRLQALSVVESRPNI